MQARVKNWFGERGYGFLVAEGRDLFFHITDVADADRMELAEGVEVEYVRDELGRKGPCARNVSIVR